MRLEKEANRKRDLITNKLWPILVDSKETIQYLKIVLQTCHLAADQAFNNKKKEVLVKDLKLTESLNKDHESTAIYRAIFELLQDENLKSFATIIRDLPYFVEEFIKRQYDKKTFADLNVKDIIG